MLVGLTGYAGSGKDAAAAGLTAIGWKRLGFADAIKIHLERLDPIINDTGTRLSWAIQTFGWDVTKRQYPEVRRLQQRYGTEVGREMIDDELWTKLAKKAYDDYSKFGYSVVITDLRFPNEAAMIRFNGGKIIRIHREGVKPAQNHVSDTNVDLLFYDHEIVNNGTVEELQTTLKTLLKIE